MSKPKHGIHAIRTKHQGGEVVTYIHDNTADGLSVLEMRKIAEKAANQPIYWNDVDCYHWMFDFEIWGHWCEMLHNNDGGLEPFEINVYQ